MSSYTRGRVCLWPTFVPVQVRMRRETALPVRVVAAAPVRPTAASPGSAPLHGPPAGPVVTPPVASGSALAAAVVSPAQGVGGVTVRRAATSGSAEPAAAAAGRDTKFADRLSAAAGLETADAVVSQAAAGLETADAVVS